jgi:hypothetical protein
MPDRDNIPDDIDEVALNVLLAEGLDLPTALAASRRDSPPPVPNQGEGPQPAQSPALVWIVLAIIAVFVAAMLVF